MLFLVVPDNCVHYKAHDTSTTHRPEREYGKN
jgi:hypothetical protein